MNDEVNQQNSERTDLTSQNEDYATAKSALINYKPRGKNKEGYRNYEETVKNSLIVNERNVERRQENNTQNNPEYSGTGAVAAVSLPQPEKRKRVDAISAGLMVLTALIYDGIQFALDFIPIVGWILSSLVGVFAWLTFFTWTSIKGWKISSVQNQFVNDIVLPFIDLIPIINALPMQTIKIVRLILLIKAEDTLFNATHGKLDIEKVSQTLGSATKLGKVA